MFFIQWVAKWKERICCLYFQTNCLSHEEILLTYSRIHNCLLSTRGLQKILGSRVIHDSHGSCCERYFGGFLNMLLMLQLLCLHTMSIVIFLI